MDHELPAETRQRIKEIVLAHAEVRGLHDLRTREAGATQFIEFHIEIDGAMSVREAHEVTDAIEAELFAAFPDRRGDPASGAGRARGRAARPPHRRAAPTAAP